MRAIDQVGTYAWGSLLCLSAACAHAQTGSARPFDIGDLLRLEAIGTIAPSADGNRVAIVIQRPRSEHERYPMEWVQDDARGDVWIARSDGRQMFRLTDGARDAAGFWDPVWSPNGTRLAMLSTRGGDAVRAYIWTVGDSAPVLASPRAVDIWVTDASLAQHFQPLAWRDDSTLIVPLLPNGADPRFDPVGETEQRAERAWAMVRSGGAHSTATALESYPDSMPTYLSTEDIVAIDAAHGSSTTFFTIPRDPTTSGDREIVLSPDRRVLAVLSSHLEQPTPGERMTRTMSKYDLGVASVSRPSDVRWLGQFSRIGATYALPLLVRWAPKGSAFVVVGRREGVPNSTCTLIDDPLHAATVTSSPDDEACVDATFASGDDRPTYVEGAGSALERAINEWSRQLDSGIVRPVWPAAPGALRSASTIILARHSSNGDTLFAASLVADSLQRVRLGSLSSGWQVASYIPATRTVYAVQRNRAVGVLDTEGFRVLIRVNDWAARFASPMKLGFRYRSEKGDSLPAIVVLPSTYVPGHRYPVVTWVYAGFVNADTAAVHADAFTASGYNLGLFAARGYVVLIPSMPLPSELAGGSNVLANLTNGVLPAVHRLVELGIADPDRIAVAGVSYGGYNTLGLITQTHLFRSAIEMSGMSDLLSWYGTFRPWDRYSDYPHLAVANAKMAEGGQDRIGASPWLDMWSYLMNSPLVFADRVRTPVMLMMGDQDFSNPGQAEEFFTAMYRLRKRAELVLYAGEGHGLQSPGNLRDMWHRIYQWLAATMPAPVREPVRRGR